MQLKHLFLLALLVLHSAALLAAEVTSVPNLFNESPSLTVPNIALGRSCYSLQASYLDLNCNPAFMAMERKRLLRINLIGNDRLKKLGEYREMIAENDQLGVANDLLSQNTPIVGKAAASAWYQYEWWAIGYVPLRGGVAYLTTNPSFPQASVLAYKESEIFGKIGFISSNNNNLHVGLQTRYVKRDYVYQQFDVLEAVDNKSIIAFRQQSALYLEPGAVYSWKGDWKPTLAWSLSNLQVWQSGDRTPSQLLYDAGLSSNIGGWEALRSTLHFTVGPLYQSMIDRLTWSSMLNFDDIASAYGSIGTRQFSLGFESRFAPITTGIAYRNEMIDTSDWASYNVQTYTLELGLVF